MKDTLSQTRPLSVGLVGAGAVGLFYSSFLMRLGLSVTILTRSPNEYNQDIIINSHNISQHHDSYQVLGYDEPSQSFDVVIVATKVLSSIDFTTLIRPYISDHTVIFLIQNGVLIEDVYLTSFDQPILRGLAFLCAARRSYCVVDHLEFGTLNYGIIRGSKEHPIIQLLIRTIEKSDMDDNFVDDIQFAIWEKLLWNAPFNSLSVIKGGVTTDEMVNSPVVIDRIRKIMTEVCLAARTFGVHLPEDLIDKKIEVTRKMSAYKTSMCLDYERNLPLETEAIVGNYINFCAQKGIDLPFSKELYQELKSFDIYHK